MCEYESMRGDCMSWARKRWHRARFGILLIVIGLLWFAQRAGWFTSEIFGPLVLLTIGVWMISYFIPSKTTDSCVPPCFTSFLLGFSIPARWR